MTTIATPSDRIADDPTLVRQFTIDEYHQMIAAGILTSTHKVELLEGWIINKMPQNPPLRNSVSRVVLEISKILPKDWTMHVQGPITLTDSEPEPDISLARGSVATYDSRHPVPADFGIVIEIGDSTAIADRRYKGELYAKAKIPEFWLINIPDSKLEVHTKPKGNKYQKLVEYSETHKVPLILDGKKVAEILVSELMAKK